MCMCMCMCMYVGGILATIDAMSLESTGRFMMVPTNGAPPKPFPW